MNKGAMKHTNGKNYYEMLDIMPGASILEIEEAYRTAKSVYSEDSAVAYSLYTSDERRQKLAELSDVYNTLTDPVKRRSYDIRLGASTGAAAPAAQTADPFRPEKDAFEEYNESGAFKDKLQLKRQLAVTVSQNQMVLEKYRHLYTRLEQISLKNSHKAFAVTSAVKGEGKTMTSMNLAYVMATEFRKKVLLLECDLRHPSISSSYLDTGRLAGLVDVLKGDVDVRRAINKLEDTSLHFLPARCSVKDSSVLLNSSAMINVMSTARDSFDYIIMDAPPILPLVDMNILSRMVDGIMLVVRAERTPKDIVTKAIKTLPRERNITGIVLNAATDAQMKKYY